MLINVPISLGELYDKISILEIKQEKIKDEDKLKNIQFELEHLSQIAKDYPIKEELYNSLKYINTELWDIENGKRRKELERDFGSEFIELARDVYIKNDLRAQIKKEINTLYGSDIVEEKVHS